MQVGARTLLTFWGLQHNAITINETVNNVVRKTINITFNNSRDDMVSVFKRFVGCSAVAVFEYPTAWYKDTMAFKNSSCSVLTHAGPIQCLVLFVLILSMAIENLRGSSAAIYNSLSTVLATAISSACWNCTARDTCAWLDGPSVSWWFQWRDF